MPVLLDAIPKQALKAVRPNTLRWLLFFVFLMLAGGGLTLWNWPTERTGFVFWFTALGLPFCVWGLFFSFRRFAYKAEQIGIESWNVEREILLENEIRRGQRAAWILGTNVLTQAGNGTGKLFSTMAAATPLMTVAIPRAGGEPIRHASLPGFNEDAVVAMAGAISKVTTQIQNVVISQPGSMACWLMIDCDNESSSRIEMAIRDELAAKTERVYGRVSGCGLAAFDAWLDNQWNIPSIFIAVTVNLQFAPIEGDAEAITAVILSNRQTDASQDAARLHRPEKAAAEMLSQALFRSLLWAKLKPETIKKAWVSGAILTTGSEWNKACEENLLTLSLTEDNNMMDTILGYAGKASPWLAIALAESVTDVLGAQVIAAQPSPHSDDVWVAVITK